MKKLLAGAWIVFALDLVIFALAVGQLWRGGFGSGDSEETLALANTLTVVAAIWLCLVNLILVVSWWRDSRAGVWIALVCGALPLLWVWAATAEVITAWALGPR